MTAAQGKSVSLEGKIWSNNQGGVVLMLKSGAWQRRFIVGKAKDPVETPDGEPVVEPEGDLPLTPLDLALRDFFDLLLDEADGVSLEEEPWPNDGSFSSVVPASE